MKRDFLGAGEAKAPPDGEDTGDDGGEDVEEAEGGVATFHEGEAVVGEGGKGGEATQESNDEEGANQSGTVLLA